MQTPMEKERQRRICVVLWAYAYEIMSDPIVSDAKFDETCKAIDLNIKTDKPNLDKWFVENFVPDTGQWIYKFPELEKVHTAYCRNKNIDVPFKIAIQEDDLPW